MKTLCTECKKDCVITTKGMGFTQYKCVHCGKYHVLTTAPEPILKNNKEKK